MSIKYKIALLFVLLVTLIVTIGSLTVYFFSAKERQDTFNTRLKSRALINAQVYAGINNHDYAALRSMNTVTAASLYNKSIAIIDSNPAQGYRFADSVNDSLFLSANIIERAKMNGEYYFVDQNKKAIAFHFLDGGNDFIVAVAATDVDGAEYLGQLKNILWGTLFFAALISFFVGTAFAQSLIRPINRITGEVNLITSNNFSQRVKVNNARDELTNLAETLNLLLDHLQDSFAIQRRFISNASHELSTPLTSISSQVEVAMQKQRSPEEYSEVLQSVYEDVKELQQLTRSLLDIAKTGSQGSLDLTEVRLDEVLFKVVSDVQKQNKNFKVKLNFEVFPEEEKLLCVFGNANLLYIAFKNIIENGCKYADNQQSSVAVIFDSANVVVKVVNNGDIIAEADIQSIFQPFFRTDTALNKPGFGLGLTLTKRILSLHKGTIEVKSNLEKGTIFTIQLPNIVA